MLWVDPEFLGSESCRSGPAYRPWKIELCREKSHYAHIFTGFCCKLWPCFGGVLFSRTCVGITRKLFNPKKWGWAPYSYRILMNWIKSNRTSFMSSTHRGGITIYSDRYQQWFQYFYTISSIPVGYMYVIYPGHFLYYRTDEPNRG